MRRRSFFLARLSEYPDAGLMMPSRNTRLQDSLRYNYCMVSVFVKNLGHYAGDKY